MKSLQTLSQKKICIVGFGVEGRSSLKFLHAHGATISVYDSKPESAFDATEINQWRDAGVTFLFEQFPQTHVFDWFVRSPGVSVSYLDSQGIEKEKITSATKLFFDFCPAKIIGVTGTKGKGTTASLIYAMVKQSGKDVYLGGNIGVNPLDFYDKLTADSIVVLELSSFQLVDLQKSPHIAVLLMVTSEHLDYHANVYEYVDAKRNILRYQKSKDYAVLNRDYPASLESDIHTDAQLYFISREGEVEQGCFVENDTIVYRQNGKNTPLIAVKDIVLPGKHNWENICAASTVAFLAGVDKKDIVAVIRTFKGLEHRLELVKTVHGVRYYDDSFSTTPETAIAAIEAFEDPKIVILGGSSKESDFTALGNVISVSKNIKAVIGIGEEWATIKQTLTNTGIQLVEGLTTMKEIVEKASELAQVGDVVLLSPACASFDMFKDYKDRGNQFKEAVNSL